MEKILSKFSVWKAKTLFLASKLTLTKVVVMAMPQYCMQTNLAPVSICDYIDKKNIDNLSRIVMMEDEVFL